MIPVDKAITARLEKAGVKLEILVDADKAMDFKAGKSIPLEEILAVDAIYTDVGQVERASDEQMKKATGTTDFKEIAETIIKKGEIHLTTEQKHKMRDEKRKRIIDYLVKNTVDPRTKAPHTAKRIEAAMEEAGIHVDPLKSVYTQVDDALKKIKTIMPISVEVITITARIPAQHAPRAYGMIKKFKITRENWQGDGSLSVTFEIPGGMQPELYDTLNKATHGEVQVTKE